MKKTLRFSTLFALIIISLVAVKFSISNAFADDGYFLEIGKSGSEDEINSNWNNLSSKYKKSLGSLKLYPKSIVDEQGETSTIMQVGEIANKNKAQAICNMLFSKNIPCFVIEGIEGKPPTVSIGIAQATSSPRSGFVLPWQDVGAAPQIMTEDEQPNAKSEADVDVAEAISVPLSDQTNSISENKIIPIIQEKRKPVNVAREMPLVQFSSNEAGRLNIRGFSNENEANDFWNNVGNKHPNLVDGLSIRIQRSLTGGSNSGIQVSVGQFADGDAAAEFCNQAVVEALSPLKCGYDVEGDVFAAAGSTRHASAYEQRRASTERRMPARQMEFMRVRELPRQIVETKELNTDESKDDSKKFWAQVAISDSKEEAAYRLKEIKKKYSKDISDTPGSISYSPNSVHGKYSAQLGSFSSEERAQSICDKLQQRGVDCLVVSK